MNTAYLNPDHTQEKQEEMGDTPGIGTHEHLGKANQAPNKDKDYQVLHSDGSLADLPDAEGEGSGALDGTVGL